MVYKVKNWKENFERDRTPQWKHLQWVPVPNKQGTGYKKIMAQKNGLEIFACWICLVEFASKCEPRGDLSKYSLTDLSINVMIRQDVLEKAIVFLSQELDWIEVIENLDINVKNIDKTCLLSGDSRSILSSSILSSSFNNNKNINNKRKENINKEEEEETWLTSFDLYKEIAQSGLDTLLSDTAWLAERREFHPGLDVTMSIKKAWKDFWLTKGGWKNKRDAAKKKPDYEIDWKRTANNALSQKINQVWIPRNAEPEHETMSEKEAIKRGYIRGPI